jgi:hypothetical protein
MDLDKYMKDSYRYKTATIMLGAIQWKFPKIKGLELIKKEDSRFTFTFQDDGIHTNQMVTEFLEELRNYGK